MTPSSISLLFALALFPGAAWANSGIGYLLVTVPAVLLALLPAILMEAPVLAGMLRTPLRRGLALSAAANVRSTWLGALIALAVDLVLFVVVGSPGPPPHRATLLATLVPMFFLTWWIEYGVIARKLPEVPRLRISGAVLAANVVSYIALFAFIAWTPVFTAYDRMGYGELHAVMRLAEPWQRKVEDYWSTNKRLPERGGDIGLDRFVPEGGIASISLQPGGTLVVELRFPGHSGLDRKKLILVPQSGGVGITGWGCRAPDIPPLYIPHPCRK